MEYQNNLNKMVYTLYRIDDNERKVVGQRIGKGGNINE
jgi:hypothetical protein